MKIEINREEQARLKVVMEEIKVILKKHDVGAYVQISGKDMIEYYFEFSPSWSCLTMGPTEDGKGTQVRFKAACKTGGPSEKERARLSMGLLLGMADGMEKCSAMLGQLICTFGPKLGEIEHYTIDPDKHD